MPLSVFLEKFFASYLHCIISNDKVFFFPSMTENGKDLSRIKEILSNNV